ncbi:translational activator of cytochrome c oxidase 1 [Venturia canescens]|uniref:translational activator of cytochrome c oxidase 1 n=1 Tax=Venturia canescens TaxID=32260 RepID=UPI001C9D3DE5|nr:translational activator of cytochrome c oxidase 1 [Venturia canescens]XP_043279663.1 translational activator of cytochrome c oxidase 1 [Venturia canescens]
MWSILRKTVIRSFENTCAEFKEAQRFAGHSKWANIKHIKAEKDKEKSALFAKLTRQMRVAITEERSCKPADNTRLAQVIEVAKKKSMPVATINAVLEKAAKSVTATELAKIDVRGPGGCILIVELLTDNVRGTKQKMNIPFKKFRCTVLDQSSRHVFDHKGFVVTELKGDLDSATEDAIAVGAEDVQEIEVDGTKCLQFISDGRSCAKVANQLSSKSYKVLSMEDKYLPKIFANLNDEDIEKTEKLIEKLEAFEEFVRIHDNIA